MIRPPASDFWRVGIAPVSIAACLEPRVLAERRDRIVWLPDPGPWRYLADPTGLRRGEALHVFVEAFDYRTKHGFIEQHAFDRQLRWQGKSTALTAACHLSYPFLVEDAGEVFMVPESYRAREIALYRARRFPDDWVRETVLLGDVAGSDATVIRHGERWWMFFAIVGANARDQRELHVAWSDRLTGPWRTYSGNPVLDDRGGARPAGTPFAGKDGAVILPVQDCRETYGGALRFVRFGRLEPDSVVAERLAPRLTGDLVSADYREGFHTLSACGDVTLFDVKRIVRTWTRHWVNLRRKMRQTLRA